VIIVGIWLGYTRVLSVLSVETSTTLLLNLALLFCVAIEPFLFYVVFQTSDLAFLDVSSSAFALDTGTMMTLLSTMMYLVVRQETRGTAHRLHPAVLKNFKVSMIGQAIGAAIFLASVSDLFWIQVGGGGFYLRFLLWYVAMVPFFTSRALVRRARKE